MRSTIPSECTHPELILSWSRGFGRHLSVLFKFVEEVERKNVKETKCVMDESHTKTNEKLIKELTRNKSQDF